MSRKKLNPKRERLLEDGMRPSPFLGYSENRIGIHLLEKDATELAIEQFRRAIWLNPYEPLFAVHLAVALIRLKKEGDAKKIIQAVLKVCPQHSFALEVWKTYWQD